MDSRFQNLTTTQLKNIIIHEMRKFALALENGATVSDLEEIREEIRLMVNALKTNEKSEIEVSSVD